MNTKLLFLIGLTTMATLSPAHAITEKYRQQLERSGCTQITDGNGCDITKTKSENMKSAPVNDKKELEEFLHDSVVDQKTDDAYQALQGYGYESTKPGIWEKEKVTVVLDIKNDMIKSATILPQ